MDFRPDEDLTALAGLAARLFADQSAPERLREVEDGSGYDEALWRTLAGADLHGVGVGEDHGGGGLGLQGVATLLEEQGRRTAPVPLWPVLTTALLPLADFGDDRQRERWLPGILDGSAPVTGCFGLDPAGTLPLRGERDGSGWRLSGDLPLVPAAPVAMALVVPFRDGDRTRVAVVPVDDGALEVTPLSVTSHESSGAVRVDGVQVTDADVLPADGTTVVDRVRTAARIALAALAVGVCEEAVAMTAAYTSQRVQFDRPLSTNQAIALRAADAYLDTERIRLTVARAAWLADRGDHAAARAASLVCAWWAADAALRTVHTTQHLHGGIGADVDYPIHRYFLWGRQIAFTIGAGAALAELGDLLETAPSIGAPA